jgi:hypothetical protein
VKKFLAILILAPLLMAAKGSPGGGCDQPLPTVSQIDLNLPDEIRKCKLAPKSPGPNASRRQTATYIVGLYDAWEECHGDLAEVNRLYGKWKAASGSFKKKKNSK